MIRVRGATRQMLARIRLLGIFLSQGNVAAAAAFDEHRQGHQWRLSSPGRNASMCDYSLHAVATRPAKVGDQLVSTSFANSITRGFAEVGELKVAVCLLP